MLLAHRRQRDADPPPGLAAWQKPHCEPRPGGVLCGDPRKSRGCAMAASAPSRDSPSHRFRERPPGMASPSVSRGRPRGPAGNAAGPGRL